MFITDHPIHLENFILSAPPESCGGTVLFVGRVRNHHDGKKVLRLFYECYRPMAEKEIGRIVEKIKNETGVEEIQVLHRVGWLEVGDIAVVIQASSGHRQEAFEACRKTIDQIKKNVPIWKKEKYEDGDESWIVCKEGEGNDGHSGHCSGGR